MTSPISAPQIWHDANNIYLQFPCPSGGTPFIQSFAKSEGGLGKALAALPMLEAAPDPRILGTNGKKVARLPTAKRSIRRQPTKPVVSEEARASLRDIMRKHGIG